ncbi:hypothetical protein ACWC0C_46860 [Streptomyces sp. NPDC001709]
MTCTDENAGKGNLLESGIDSSIGTVGDALDNALMESRSAFTKRS